MRHVVVQVRKSNPVFCSYWLPYNDFIDVVEFIPIFIARINFFKCYTNILRIKPCYPGFISLIKGSNFGPPGIAIFRALAVKKLFVSNR